MLADAVLEIAQEMEEVGNSGSSLGCDLKLISSWAKQLRRAVKAAEGSAQQQVAMSPMAASMQHVSEIEKAKAEFRGQKEKAVLKEETEGKMALLVGGKQDGDMFPLVGEVPVTARVPIGDEIYQLDADGKLYYDQGATERRKGRG